jgi:hypothetical protein
MEMNMSLVLERLNRIPFRRMVWILVVAETLHNIEEAIWLPAWSQTAGTWHPSVTAFEFRFAVTAITIVFYGVICYFSRYDTRLSQYLMGGALVVILFNVFVPHLVATVALAHYAPGVISGILLNIPVTLYLLRRGMMEGFFSVRVVILGAIGLTIAVAPLLPAFFAVGRFVERSM